MPIADDDSDHTWLRIRSAVRQAVGDSTWHLWLESLEVAQVAGHVVTIEATEERRGWIEDRFGRLLQACAAAVLGPEAEVHVVVAQSAVRTPAHRGGRARVAPRSAGAGGSPPPPNRPPSNEEQLNPRLTFDQFVIGDSNRLAHGAALAVAELPGLAYNPLFICGPPGLGKTHLLHSIANYLTLCDECLTVRYTTVEGFTNHFLGALHSGGVDAFKDAYRGVDVLLVDDVQFLQSKVKTEEEFFHTFNALLGSGAQVVLTSDRLPRDMSALQDRLRERFEAGLVTDVRPADYGTRLTILRKRVQQDAVVGVDPGALELIADRVTENIRSLEGALIRVVAFGSLTSRPATADLAEEVLSGLYPDLHPRQRTLREIQERTCEAFSITLDELLSPSRAARFTWARQVAMYLSRELTDQSLPAIGRAFGNRNHTTVIHACRRTAQRMAADRESYDAVERLSRVLRGDRPDDCARDRSA